MKIPKKLKIGGHSIMVVIEKNRLETEGDGHSDKKKNELVIEGNQAQSQQEVTFFHEMFHFLNATLDHTLLDSLAEQLYQVLSDNDMLK